MARLVQAGQDARGVRSRLERAAADKERRVEHAIVEARLGHQRHEAAVQPTVGDNASEQVQVDGRIVVQPDAGWRPAQPAGQRQAGQRIGELAERLGAGVRLDQLDDPRIQADRRDHQERPAIGDPDVDLRSRTDKLRDDGSPRLERQSQLARPDVTGAERHHPQGDVGVQDGGQDLRQDAVATGPEDGLDTHVAGAHRGRIGPVWTVAGPQLDRPGGLGERLEDASDGHVRPGARAGIQQDDGARHG